MNSAQENIVVLADAATIVITLVGIPPSPSMLYSEKP
jgi:hypothetical protein